MQATSTLLPSISTRQHKAGTATTAAQQLVLFSLPEPIACCWDLICPEEAWEQPLRCEAHLFSATSWRPCSTHSCLLGDCAAAADRPDWLAGM